MEKIVTIKGTDFSVLKVEAGDIVDRLSDEGWVLYLVRSSYISANERQIEMAFKLEAK